MLDLKSKMIHLYNVGEEEVNFVINKGKYRYSSILDYRKTDLLYSLDSSSSELLSEFEREVSKLHIKKNGDSAVKMGIVLANTSITE